MLSLNVQDPRLFVGTRKQNQTAGLESNLNRIIKVDKCPSRLHVFCSSSPIIGLFRIHILKVELVDRVTECTLLEWS